MMQIVIAGGSGLIGRRLTQMLINKSYEVIVLTRNPKPRTIQAVKYVFWNGNEIKDIPQLTPSYAFINLAGENLSIGRWTKRKKEKILSSRVNATQAMACFIRTLEFPPEVVIQGSAIGFYDNSGKVQSNENAPKGEGFLPAVVKRWEQAMDLDEEETKNLIFIRTGVIFDPTGGAFPNLIQAVKYFMGGKIGTGRQFISWIHWEDEVRAIGFLLNQPVSGIFNLVSPNPVSQFEFTRSVAQFLHRPSFFHYPKWLIKLLMGEKGETLIIKGENVYPHNLLKAGFRFKYSDLATALEELRSTNC